MNSSAIAIDSKEKIKFVRSFINELKADKDISLFLVLNIDEIGYFDFGYVCRKWETIGDIEKSLKESRYSTVRQCLNQIKQVIMKFADYLLSNDPLQATIVKICNRIGNFENRFIEEFRENKISKPDTKVVRKQQKLKEKQKKKEEEKNQEPVPELKRSTFAQKLQMCYLLRAHEDNYEYIRYIGESYGIGKQTDEEYVVQLDFNSAHSPWLELIEKRGF